jgi:hypothetical protein
MICKCPACGNPLRECHQTKDRVTTVFLYCAVGRCHSQAANDGAYGDTLTEAFDRLDKAVEQEEVEA